MSAMNLILGCAVWFPLMIWIVSLVHWMITQEIDLLSGIIGIWIAIGLGYICFKPPVPALSPLAFFAVIVTIVSYPAVRQTMNQRELREVDVDALKRAYENLAMRPMDTLAQFRIARLAYTLGMPGHALRIAEDVASRMPDRVFVEEHRIVRQWRKAINKPDYFRPIQCIECNLMNDPGAIHCRRCGAPFLLHRAQGKAIGKQQAKKIIACWAALMVILAGIPMATALTPMLSIPVILVLMGMAGLAVYLAFRGGEA